jgi:hypothetical protein
LPNGLQNGFTSNTAF